MVLLKAVALGDDGDDNAWGVEALLGPDLDDEDDDDVDFVGGADEEDEEFVDEEQLPWEGEDGDEGGEGAAPRTGGLIDEDELRSLRDDAQDEQPLGKRRRRPRSDDGNNE